MMTLKAIELNRSCIPWSRSHRAEFMVLRSCAMKSLTGLRLRPAFTRVAVPSGESPSSRAASHVFAVGLSGSPPAVLARLCYRTIITAQKSPPGCIRVACTAYMARPPLASLLMALRATRASHRLKSTPVRARLACPGNYVLLPSVMWSRRGLRRYLVSGRGWSFVGRPGGMFMLSLGVQHDRLPSFSHTVRPAMRNHARRIHICKQPHRPPLTLTPPSPQAVELCFRCDLEV